MTGTRTVRPEKKKRNRFNSLPQGWNIAFSVVLGLISILMLAPMVLVIIVSFSSEASISRIGYSFMPAEWSLSGYAYLFKIGDQVGQSYIVTIFYTVAGTLMSLTVMTLYAYVISQRNFRGRKFFTWILFFTMLFGGGLVPSYILNTKYLNLYNTIWIFLLPSLVSAYNVIILRTFIQSTIPESLFEAARIDGAGHFRIYGNIVLPLFKAGIATIGLFNVVSRWNDWFTGMLYIQDARLVPLQTLLQKIQDQIEFLKTNAAVASTPDGLELLRNLPTNSLRMACTVIIVAPILMAYPFFQRYFVSGLTIGSVKG